MFRKFRTGINAARLTAATLALIVMMVGCSDESTQPIVPTQNQTATLSKNNPGVRHVMEVQDRNTERMFEKKGVVGIGTGMTEDGEPAIVIFTEKELPEGLLPDQIEGVPVIQKVGGAVELTGKPPSTGGKNSTSTTGTSTGTTTRLARPVPIGVSTSNYYDCGAGTIGVRVKNNDGYYLLSCNHIFARLNAAGSGELILQPGRSDNNCVTVLSDEIARVSDLEPIIYSAYANNIMDAAIASTLPSLVSNSTPPDGYGLPSNTTALASVGMSVQKYGRTTGLTTGKVCAINCTVLIPYPAAATRFVDQIVVEPLRKNKSFVEGGDSGSLVVTSDGDHPIGLVYAKNGDLSYVSPIDPILQRFGVQIDGK
jgi:hypothetical protein